MSHADGEKDDRPDRQEAHPTPDYDPGVALVGGKIGRYKLIKVLGEGGCGMVYLAEQRTPVTRRVALKVVKPGMDTKQVIARFEAERQALALLDHPNIASVHDAGTTKTGRPYFVMEYVKGVSITEHCDREKLGIEERLGLFLQVCEAVQYAHQKGIIHRDIKPSNIQVAIHGEKAVPKIIDFGLAKALSQLLTERTLVTEQGQMVGTPEYMSPEQAEMTNQDIDTRTDIYSLGVVLYELLSGTLPFDPDTLREGGADHMRRMIREKDPKTPSTRLSTIAGEKSQKAARSRNTDVRSLARRLHGDLDWITIKAMEKDRMRRYQTAHALAEDIQRHLNHEPVLAGPPSTVYRLGKLLRRHRTQALATVLIAVLVTSVAVISVMFMRATARSRKAEDLEHRNILAQVRESFSQRDLATAVEQLEPILDSKHVGDNARLLHASILIDGGYPEQAEAQLQELLDVSPDVAGMAHSLLARIYWEGSVSESEKAQRVEAHKRQAEDLLPESAESYFLQALTTSIIPEKLRRLDRALELDRGHYESRRLRTWTYYASRNFEDMEDDALCMTMSRPKVAEGYTLLGIAQRQQGKFEKALRSFHEALGHTDTQDAGRLDLYRHRCETYLSWADYRRLISEAQACSAQLPDEPKFAFYTFCAHVGLGEYEQAMSCFRQAVAADPKNWQRLIRWANKHVSDTLAAGQSWHPAGAMPEEEPFIWMQTVEKFHRQYVSRKAKHVITDGFDPEWSADGKKLAFNAGVHGYSGVAIYDLETTRTELLTVPGKNPKWSPDGKHIAFVRDCQVLPMSEFASAERRFQHRRMEQEEVWVMRADGSEPRRLVRGGHWPFWSPNSEHVFYRTWQDGMLYRISVATPGVVPEPILEVPWRVKGASVSGDAQNVAWSYRHFSENVLEFQVVNLSAAQEVTWRRMVPQYGGVFTVAWSPGGDHLCTIGGTYGVRYPEGAWVHALRAGEAIRSLAGWAGQVCWSQDEAELAFVLHPFYEIWIAPAACLESDRTYAQYHEDAIDHYTRLIQAESSAHIYRVQRAMQYAYLGDYEKVLADVKILVQNSYSDLSDICCSLASVAMELDDAADPGVVVRLSHLAVEHAQAGEPLHDRAVSTLVRAHCRAGHWNAAVAAFQERGDVSRAYVHDTFFLAMSHWHVNNREEAREWYNRGVEMRTTWPSYLWVSRLRAEVEALLGIEAEEDN